MSRQLTLKEEARFFQQLASLLGSGFSPQQSLSMAGGDCRASFQRYLQQASADIGRGQDLATVLSRPPRPFSGWTVSLIRMAEYSGALADICQQLAIAAEQQQRRRRLYHSLGLATIAVALSVFALLAVLLHGDTNLLTRPSFWLLGFLLIAVLAMALQGVGSPYLSQRLRQLLSNVPVIGKIMQAQSMLYLSELALPLRCGVSTLAAVELIRTHIPDAELQANLTIAARQIRSGQSLSHSLKGKLPTIAEQFIQTGDETGNLDGMLQKMAEYYEGELERRLRQLQGILKPLSILAIGVIVILIGIQMIHSILNALPGE